MKSTNGRTQNQIEQDLINLMGKDTFDKYSDLTYAEMARCAELSDYKKELLQAEKEWFECE